MLSLVFIAVVCAVCITAPQPASDPNSSNGLSYAIILVFLFIPTAVGAGIFSAVTSALGICVLAKPSKGFAPKGVYISIAVFELLSTTLLLIGNIPMAVTVPAYSVNCVIGAVILASAIITCITAAAQKKAQNTANEVAE